MIGPGISQRGTNFRILSVFFSQLCDQALRQPLTDLSRRILPKSAFDIAKKGYTRLPESARGVRGRHWLAGALHRSGSRPLP